MAAVAGEMLGKVVLVRDQRAGVHVGTLESLDVGAKTAVLKDARKVWYWDGAASVHGIAVRGLKHKTSKVCPRVSMVVSTDVIEVVLCTADGATSVLEAPEWKP